MTTAMYTPLNELRGSTLGTALPDYGQGRLGDQLGVDLPRLGSIAMLGGFNKSFGLHATWDDVSASPVETGSAHRHDTASLSSVQYDRVSGVFCKRNDLGLTVHLSEVKKLASNNNPGLAPRPEAWASLLDLAVREGLHDAAWKRATSDKTPFADAASFALGAFVGIPVGMRAVFALAEQGNEFVQHYYGPLWATGMAVGGVAFMNLAKWVDSRRIRNRSRPIYSLEPLSHADRAVAVSLRMHGLREPLVKAL